jgi:hypothetical protein
MSVSMACKDLAASKAFFEAMGYAFDPALSGPTGARLILGDNLAAMLLAEDFARSLNTKALVDPQTEIEMRIFLTCSSREEVDALVAKALAAGGTAPRQAQDHGFMYMHGFEDFDGHGWGLIYSPNPPPQAAPGP